VLRVKISLSWSWFIGLVYNAGTSIPTAEVLPTGDCAQLSILSENFKMFIGSLAFFVLYLILLLLLMFCYTSIAVVINRKTKVPLTSAANQEREEKYERIRRNTIVTQVLVSLCFLVTWSWNSIFFFYHNLGYSVDFESDFYHFSVAAIFSNCCLNPIIYALKYEQFQTRAKEIFHLLPNKETSMSDVVAPE